MRKLIAAINMSLDGFCDHTAMTAGEGLHQHYADLLNGAGTILYGRKTYHLMEYWKTVLESPSGEKATDEFAVAINRIEKIVFSHTLPDVEWQTARLAEQDLETTVSGLKQQQGNDILIGSRSPILSSMGLGLVDELQLCIHPVIVGSGLPLFENIKERTVLKLKKTKPLEFGAMVLYYELVRG